MFPKLYNSNETNFIHNGLGLLTGSISAIVTEELNGMFELRIEYDSEGFLADVIQEEMIIKAKANDKQAEQLFRIYSITKNHENDNLIIDAQHITYDLGNNFVEKLEARNLTKRQVMQLIGSSTNYEHPFNVTSSNTTTQSSTSLYRTNPLQMIAGMEGSVLQIWGGQIERDNFHLIMHDRRSSDDGVLVTYKKNLTGLNAKFDISNLVTRIFPYVFIPATDDEPEQLITVPGGYIDSPHVNNYEMPYILPVDFSHEEGIETSQDLLNASQNWFIETGRDNPRVEMEVQFEHLWETEEYKDVAALELVGMGDTITVQHSKLNVEGTAIVNRIEYDSIARKNRAVDVGNVKASFTDKVNQVGNIVDRVEQVEQSANQAIRAANGKNTIHYGPDEPTDGELDDIWFRVVDGEYTRTYRFDGIQWQLVISADVKDIEETANSAHNRANDAVEKANLATSNANEAIAEAQTAFDEAQTALTTASGASELAGTVYDLAAALDATVSGHTTTITDIEGELSSKMTTIDADNKYATQSALQQTSQSLSSDIVAVRDDLDGLEIGGRNLATNSDFSDGLTGITIYNPASFNGVSIFENGVIKITSSDSSLGGFYVSSGYRPQSLAGQTYTVTIWAKGIGSMRFGQEGISGGLSTVTINSDEFMPYSHTYTPNVTTSNNAFSFYSNSATDGIYIDRFQIEKGNKATDWSLAEEDIQSQFSSITQLVDSITSRVGDSEGNITSLQQTSSSFANQISNAQGDISSLTQTATGLQNRIANAEGDISTVTNTASALQNRMSDAEGGINTLTATAGSLDSTIKSVRDDLDGLEIGGRNYFRPSSIDAYASYNNLVSYEEDSFTIRYNKSTGGMLAVGNNGFRPESGQYTFSGYLIVNGEIPSSDIFNRDLISTYGSNAFPREYNTNTGYFKFTQNFPGTSKWIIHTYVDGLSDGDLLKFSYPKFEKGNKASDWTPAPEDMATQSQFTQLSNNINARVEKGDVINQINISTEDILISGKKLILDGDTTVTGTFRVANANITELNASKLSGGTADFAQFSAINLSANSITGGILSSQNSVTTFSLNTGNMDFSSTASIRFNNSAGGVRRIQNNRSAILSFPISAGSTTPMAALGVVNQTGTINVNDASFRGIRIHGDNVSHTNDLINDLWTFSRRVDQSLGSILFNLGTGRKGIFPQYTASHSYDLGTANNKWDTLHVNRIQGAQVYISNPVGQGGWSLDTQPDAGSTAMTFRGINAGITNFVYNLGTTANPFNFGRINHLRPTGSSSSIGASGSRYNYVYTDSLIEGSDVSIKDNIQNSKLGLDFINDLNIVDFRMKDSGHYKSGVIAQELEQTIINHRVDISKQSMVFTNDDIMGVAYTQLIAPTMRAVQQLDRKVDDEFSTLRKQNEELLTHVESQALKIAKLEQRINYLEAS